MKISLIGPLGANFTDIARESLCGKFNLRFHNSEIDLVRRNEQVVPSILSHGGYGFVAMETLAQGQLGGTAHSFVQLLEDSPTTELCSVIGIAAERKKINFALMTRKDVLLKNVKEVVCHLQSFRACHNNIRVRGWQFTEADSNGQAAQDVATKKRFAKSAVLGPQEAADIYPLKIWDENFEDRPCFTTFYLLGPRKFQRPVHSLRKHDSFMSLLIARLRDTPGSVASVTDAFRKIDMRYINTHYIANGESALIVNYRCRRHQMDVHDSAMEQAKRAGFMQRYVLLGLFPLYDDQPVQD